MDVTRRLPALLWALLLLCIGRLWVIPLPSSFWVDETGTLFVVRHGATHPSLAIAPQVTASIYFWLPRSVEAVFHPGLIELAYRIPSLLAIAAACLLIARLAQRLIHPEAAWFAVFACLSLRGFNYQAADARPYALGTLVAVTSVWALIRWLDSNRWRDALPFIVIAALLWRVHLVYWPFYAVFAIYAAARLASKETPVTPLRAVGVFVALGLTLIPVLYEAVALARQAGAHTIVPAPGMSELWRSLKIGLVAECAAVAWLLSRFWKSSLSTISSSSLVLVAAFWLIQPLGLFAFSWLTGNSIFVDRYLSIALPGAALAATAAAAFFMSPRCWHIAAAVLGCGVLLFMGRWNVALPPHHNSDWRGAAAAVNRLVVTSKSFVPVICPSAFIEARPPVWTPDYPLPGFLYSPLDAYPVHGKTYLFPYGTSKQAELYAARLEREELTRANRFVLYGPLGGVEFWQKWYGAQPDFHAWPSRHIADFGDVGVVLFERP